MTRPNEDDSSDENDSSYEKAKILEIIEDFLIDYVDQLFEEKKEELATDVLATITQYPADYSAH